METDSCFQTVFEIQSESGISAVYIQRLYRNDTGADRNALAVFFFIALLETADPYKPCFLKREEAVQESLSQSKLVISDGIQSFCLDPVQTCIESDDTREIHRARFESVRHEIRNLFGVADGAGSS